MNPRLYHSADTGCNEEMYFLKFRGLHPVERGPELLDGGNGGNQMTLSFQHLNFQGLWEVSA